MPTRVFTKRRQALPRVKPAENIVMTIPVKVKVCGLTRVEDVALALALGAEAIGINCYSGSPRGLPLEKAGELIEAVPGGKRVLVDVSPSPEHLERCKDAGFDFFQIHFGLEVSLSALAAWSGVVGPDKLWLAPRIPPGVPFPEMILKFSNTIVSDTFAKGKVGGTGETHDWFEFFALQDIYPEHKWILAGGLTPENIAFALGESGAHYVDVNSGVESAPGLKDAEKLKAFFENLRTAGEKKN